MTITSALTRLQAAIQALRLQIEPVAGETCRVSRFDKQLFPGDARQLGQCLAILEQSYARLCSSQHDEQRLWLAERVANQVAALQRELGSRHLRPQRERVRTDPQQAKYAEYLGYQQRLQQMIDERETRLAQAETLAVQQQLKQDLTVLEQRMGRCKAAIKQVSWALALRGKAE